MRYSICGTSVIKSEKRCPNCGNRKKYFNSKRIIAIVLLLCMCTPLNTTSHAEYDNDYSQLPSQMMDYILGKEDDALLSRDNYAYVKFVDNYLSNTLATVTTEIIHLLGKTDSLYVIEPEYYATILVNIMALTESTNASSTAEQKKYDNLKTMEDYAVDVTQMMANTVNVYIGVSENLPALFNEISHAISGVSTIIDSTEECMEVYSNLETVLQNYDRFQIFLDSVAENSDGNLKQAALSLRNGMTEAMKVKLASYTNVANINTDLMSEYFFSDTFMELLKEIPEYASDDSFKFFIDSADGFFNKFGVLNTAWEIGAAIGTLAGNLVVGGEDLMSRVREMVALTHIRSALVSAINQAGSDFLSAYAAQTPDNGVAFCNKYIDLAWFLRACDLRGEYCLASIVSSDAKFLTWFNKENIEHAEIWYATRSDGIKIGHSKLHGMIYTDGMTESPETETLSSDNVYSGQNDLSSSEVFNPVGRWTVNTEKTNSANSTALRSFFGSSIEYGFEMILGQDGTASWYIAAGNGGYGSYSFQGASGYLNYTDYEEGYGLTVPLYVLQENGIWYILMEYNGYNLYWTKEADTVIDVPAEQPSANPDYSLYIPVIEKAIAESIGDTSYSVLSVQEITEQVGNYPGFLHDCDKDGVDELFILHRWENNQIYGYSIYGIENNQLTVRAEKQELFNMWVSGGAGADCNIGIVSIEGDEYFYTERIHYSNSGEREWAQAVRFSDMAPVITLEKTTTQIPGSVQPPTYEHSLNGVACPDSEYLSARMQIEFVKISYFGEPKQYTLNGVLEMLKGIVPSQNNNTASENKHPGNAYSFTHMPEENNNTAQGIDSTMLYGDWYRNGKADSNGWGQSAPTFSLYSDGSAIFASEYGTGSWVIVNGNQLRLTSFYGESEIQTITSLEPGKFIIADGTVFYNYIIGTNSAPPMAVQDFSAIAGLLVGDWYRDGKESKDGWGNACPTFTLYSDGTATFASEYGTGSWAIVNRNQVRFTTSYGESLFETLISLEPGKFTIEDGTVFLGYVGTAADTDYVGQIPPMSTGNLFEILCGIWEYSESGIVERYVFNPDGSYQWYPYVIGHGLDEPVEDGIFEIQSNGEIFLYPDRTSFPQVIYYFADLGLECSVDRYFQKVA